MMYEGLEAFAEILEGNQSFDRHFGCLIRMQSVKYIKFLQTLPLAQDPVPEFTFLAIKLGSHSLGTGTGMFEETRQ